MALYIVTGTSIDGRVFATGYGWTPIKRHATKMTEAQADLIIARRREANKHCELDDVIGHLEMKEVNK